MATTARLEREPPSADDDVPVRLWASAGAELGGPPLKRQVSAPLSQLSPAWPYPLGSRVYGDESPAMEKTLVMPQTSRTL